MCLWRFRRKALQYRCKKTPNLNQNTLKWIGLMCEIFEFLLIMWMIHHGCQISTQAWGMSHFEVKRIYLGGRKSKMYHRHCFMLDDSSYCLITCRCLRNIHEQHNRQEVKIIWTSWDFHLISCEYVLVEKPFWQLCPTTTGGYLYWTLECGVSWYIYFFWTS